MNLFDEANKLSPEDWAREGKAIAQAAFRRCADLDMRFPPELQFLLDIPEEELVRQRRNALLKEAEQKGVMTDRAHRDIRHDLPKEVSTLMFMEVMDALYDNGYVVVRKCDLGPQKPME